MIKLELNKIFIAGLFFWAMIFNTGCTTMICGTSEEIVINSDPPNALVVYKGQKFRTPAKFSVKRKKHIRFKVSKEGFEEKIVSLGKIHNSKEKYINATVMLCALIPGEISREIDFSTGAAYKHTPNPIFIVLNPLSRTNNK